MDTLSGMVTRVSAAAVEVTKLRAPFICNLVCGLLVPTPTFCAWVVMHMKEIGIKKQRTRKIFFIVWCLLTGWSVNGGKSTGGVLG